MTENELTYWAFLSHSQQDNGAQRADAPEASWLCWGDWLHEALKTFSIPTAFAGQLNARGEVIPERIEPIFHDREEQPGNATLSEEVRRALDQSKCLIVICSPRSAASLQVNEQVRYFKQLGRGNRILAIVVAGEPNASDGNKPGRSAEDECFVPALRHPVTAEGTLDLTRRDRGPIFADARHGDDKREIQAKDHRNGETELEIAKIQLIAGLIGVGFNELLRREQKRRFAGFAEAQNQVREVQGQLEAARNEIREAQNKSLEAQNLPPDIQSQIQEAQNKAREAQGQLDEARNQVREAQNKVLDAQQQSREALNQVQEFQGQARDVQNQLEEARSQVRETESRFLEAQKLAHEIQSQLETARNEVREAQSKVSTTQDPSPDLQNQLQEAQNKAREAQDQVREAQSQAQGAAAQIEEARQQAREAQDRASALLEQSREAQHQVQEFQNRAQEAERKFVEAQNLAQEVQGQLEAARNEVRAAQNKVLEVQNLPPDVQNQIQEAQNKAREAQNQIDEAKDQARKAQGLFEEAKNQVLAAQEQAREAQNKVQEFQNQVHAAEQQSREAQQQAHEVQGQLAEAQDRAQETQRRLEESQAEVLAAQKAALSIPAAPVAQNQVSQTTSPTPQARHLTKVLAFIAVVTLVAAGVAAGIALWRRQAALQALAQAPVAEVWEPGPTQTTMDSEQIRQVLLQIGGTEQETNQLRSLNKLASWLPTGEISDALKSSSILSEDRPRSQFQKQLLIRQSWTDPVSAMTGATGIDGKVVNDDGAADSPVYLQLAVLDNWRHTDLPAASGWVRQLTDAAARNRALAEIIPSLVADNPTNALVWLNGLKPAPDEQIYARLFQSWRDQQPEAALDWVKAQPDSESKNQALAACIEELAKTDAPKALGLAESLPDGTWRNVIIADLFNVWSANDLVAATKACQQLPEGAAREKAWEYVLNRRIANDPATAADDVKNLGPGDYRQRAIAALSHRWADTDTPAALAWAQSLPPEAGQTAAVNEVAADWAHKDLSGATNWVESLPDGENKDAALLAVAGSVGKSAPQLAANLCTLITTPQPTNSVIFDLAVSLAKDDQTNALAWASSLKEGAARQVAISAMAQSWAQNDLPQLNAAAKYIAAMPAGDDQQAAIKGLLAPWTSADPESAVNWLASFPSTNAQPEQMQSVIQMWSQHEPTATARWLSSLPTGTVSDAMANAFFAGAVEKYPAVAVAWTQSVTDDAARQKFQVQLARQWLKTDPSAATNWINSLNLPADVRQSIKP